MRLSSWNSNHSNFEGLFHIRSMVLRQQKISTKLREWRHWRNIEIDTDKMSKVLAFFSHIWYISPDISNYFSELWNGIRKEAPIPSSKKSLMIRLSSPENDFKLEWSLVQTWVVQKEHGAKPWMRVNIIKWTAMFALQQPGPINLKG